MAPWSIRASNPMDGGASDHGCPTFGAFLRLRPRWDTTNLNRTPLHLVRRRSITPGDLRIQQSQVHTQLRAVMDHVVDHHLSPHLVLRLIDPCLPTEHELPVAIPFLGSNSSQIGLGLPDLRGQTSPATPRGWPAPTHPICGRRETRACPWPGSNVPNLP